MEILLRLLPKTVIKSILNVLDVYAVGWGNAALTIEGNVLKLSRKSEAFSKVISKAEGLREILESKKMMEREKAVSFLRMNLGNLQKNVDLMDFGRTCFMRS